MVDFVTGDDAHGAVEAIDVDRATVCEHAAILGAGQRANGDRGAT